MAETEPVAIIGIGCRFSGGATSPSKLWELLQAPRELACRIPASRFRIDAFYHPDGDYHGRTNVQESYFLDQDVRTFDAAFFNILPAEAMAMDPQQRLFLETVYESIDAAGLQMDALQGSMTGVFCGTLRSDYGQIQAIDPQALPSHVVTGNSPAIMANRVSYYFDWRGPSMAVDTGCSSSLLAVHLAVQALQQDDCSLAVAAGSNLMLLPGPFIADAKARMLSPTGRSHMWDTRADGYARAGLSPQNCLADRCQYFEAHGTGTQVGDAQEAASIHGSFFEPPSAPGAIGQLYVGSIKTILGHTEATAGLAGLIKAALSVQHGLIVPNRLMEQLNPKVEPFAARLRVPTECVPWPALPQGCPRRASVNSFGFGGANVHVVLESYTPLKEPVPATSPTTTPSCLPLVFLAASEQALIAVLESYAATLQNCADMDLAGLAMGLWTRRSAHNYRVVLTAHSLEEGSHQIDAELCRRKATMATPPPSTIVFRPSNRSRRIMGVFAGQGVQWPQMGLDLIESSPQARRWMAEMQNALDQLPVEFRPGFCLAQELSLPAASSRVHEGLISLPLRTAIQMIQVNVLRSVGFEFSCVVGHSSGEIVATYAAGVLTASNAFRIAYLRARAMHASRASVGRMMAVNLSWKQAQAACALETYAGRVSVAAANSPSSVTLGQCRLPAGAAVAVEESGLQSAHA